MKLEWFFQPEQWQSATNVLASIGQSVRKKIYKSVPVLIFQKIWGSQAQEASIELINPAYRRHIIFFGGVGFICRDYKNLFQLLHTSLKSNIVAANYRGTTCMSTMCPTATDFIQDGLEQVDALLAKGVQAKDITLWGRSLGGGVALEVAAKLAEQNIDVTVVNERSFRRLSDVVAATLPFDMYSYANSLAQSIDWQLNPIEAAKKCKGKLIVVYHEQDKTIPHEVSFIQGLKEIEPNHPSYHEIKMAEDSLEPVIDTKVSLTPFSHAHSREFTQRELDELSIAITQM